MRNKKKQWLAVLGVVGIVLAGCSATGASGEGTTGAATSSAIPSESAAPATTSSDDGRARLDAIREVAETAMQSGDIWTTAVTATDATVESVMAENQKPHAGSWHHGYRDWGGSAIGRRRRDHWFCRNLRALGRFYGPGGGRYRG